MVEVAEADLISGFFESILFGIFFVLSTTSLVLLLRRQSYPKDARRSLAESRSASTLWTRWSGTLRILRQSPLIVANVLLMITLTVVSKAYLEVLCYGQLSSPALRHIVASTHPCDCSP